MNQLGERSVLISSSTFHADLDASRNCWQICQITNNKLDVSHVIDELSIPDALITQL